MKGFTCTEDKCDFKNDCPIIKHFYDKGKADGAKEFAELLKKKFNEFIDYDDNGEQTFESNPDLVWIAIDEVLAEWQKGAEQCTK